MSDVIEPSSVRLLTLPEPSYRIAPVRAKAILFHDPRSASLIGQVERVARSEASVLVVGETGTGKELIARHLHTHSGRKGPFLAINCGAFSESLIDAELFGHEAGAFTGAVRARAGWFEAADGGTLFLDEIGDLSLPLQVKLLRLLQERQVTRLGSRKSVAFDVRVVAATNVDLRQAVETQQFRADLFYRLSVARINLPPLRERPGDVLPLAQHFIDQYGPRLGLQNARLLPDAQQALLDHPWPGNIRELENVIHFALIVCRHGEVQRSDLNLLTAPPPREDIATALAAAAVRGAEPVSVPVPPAPGSDALRQVFERLLHEASPQLFQSVEETLVRAAFAHAGDNQVRAARVLGITRNTLRTLLKRHGLLDATSLQAGDEPAD